MAEKIVYTVKKKIALAAFNETTQETLVDFFSPQEFAGVADEPNRTKAGMVAAKKALAELLMSITSLFDIDEKEIVLSHKPNGAPCIVSLPVFPDTGVLLRTEQFSISVSHTRNTAYAIAVYQGEAYE